MKPATSAKDRLPPFEVVLDEHGPALLRFCVARLGRDGEDAFQETLLAALEHYDQLRDPAAAKGWLFSIAHRKIIDASRSRAHAPLPDDQIEDHAEAWRDPLPSGVWAEVARLPPKQCEAVGLRYLADLPYSDIATIMETSAEAARRNVFEGLRQLRTDLSGSREVF